MSTLDVAVVQEPAVAGDVAGNSRRAVAILAEHPGVDIVVLPELFLCGYRLDTVGTAAMEVSSAAVAELCAAAAAHGTVLLTGFAERAGDAVYNSLLCIDPTGAVAGVYRKTHLFGAEADAFAAGDRIEVIEVAGLRLGPMICFDVEFPEVARTLALSGVDLFVVASANMEPYHRDHRVACLSRALENRTSLVYSNLVGAEAGLTFVGGSRVVSGDGDVIVECGGAVATAQSRLTLGAGVGAEVDEDVDYLRHRRPELYRLS
ncbi:nitrilase-related carbon-nitrogen hydrolase [Mycobacterium sp. ITM-2016-00317]|uniref:nitrilase-related carbon-nitrogen hydrolase n=1 Tax=Mycobacterium sp. ITM-2016-00317 TaxID=2099694 RepID=UPI000D475781|nr:nitrilase-related carbon-nitrogen hydrolase [Mycobacterium sp. ITM-2016-00317]WNG85354.1 nitrilase-related carbon-nitrogen hydrolase [Mycobacterium sp. ITM-2016-00317]